MHEYNPYSFFLFSHGSREFDGLCTKNKAIKGLCYKVILVVTYVRW